MTPSDPASARLPDYEREHHAVAALTRAMADTPGNVLQIAAELARDVCNASAAGISPFEGGAARPCAVAGVPPTSPPGALPWNPAEDVRCLLVPFHDHGTPIGTLWVLADRQFDDEDARLLGVLSALASAGWQLWQASEVIAADSRHKDDFLATLAHELRNPLSAITAASAVLQQRTQPPSATQAIGIIVRQTQHMSRLTGDLLDIARIVSGKLSLKKESLDLRTIVTQAIEGRRAQMERRFQSLTVAIGDTPAIVDGDPVRLSQVISNLLDNAMKYTPEHGDIALTLSCVDAECSISVRDSGAGIPAEEVERIFLPFTQLRASTQSVAGGLGLGLALVRTIAELHGGTVSVVSEGAGRGSCFILRLPTLS